MSSVSVYTIEKGIEIPPFKPFGFKRKASACADVLEKMKVGDSILVPRGKRMGFVTQARKREIKLVTRKADDGNFRIWRVS